MPKKAAQATEPGFKPAPVMRPRQQVETQLRAAIHDGTFATGEKFPSEANLAEKFGVSRATVREALRALSEAGLISTVPGAGGGSFVTYFDHHRLADFVSDRLGSTFELGSISYDEIVEFRGLVEVPAARLAAANRSETHVKQLRDAITLARETPLEDPRTYEINTDFHRIVAEASGNRLLATFIVATLSVTSPINQAASPGATLGRTIIRDHVALTDAIEKQDTKTAERLAIKHLDFLKKNAAYPQK
jgi:DNA-binding FadR family transcriptional regulator